jgi:hypothetical protein
MLWLPESDRVRKYKRIREVGRSLNGKIVKVIPKEVIDRTAREMRLMVKGVLVFDSEGELDFLFDRIIYDVPWDSRTAIEHFEAESDFELSVEEEDILKAMKEAYFSLFEVVGGVAGEFLQLSDLLTDNQIELMELSLSNTASKELLLATRVISINDICLTTGTAYPFLPEHRDTLISGLEAKQTVRRSRRRPSIRRMDYSDPRNYSLYFFRHYKRLDELEISLSSDWEE